MSAKLDPRPVVVIGAGITGMGAAWRLHCLGHPVVVLEAGARVGGVVESRRTNDDIPLELGPQTLSTKDPELLADLEALGLRPRMREANPASGRRYIVHQGVPARLPSGPLGFFTSPLLSVAGKARALAEPLIPENGPTSDDPMDESVADFVTRRFGREVLDRFVDPFVSGVYAGDPKQLAMGALFPSVVEAAQAKGSVVRGMFGGPRSTKTRRTILWFTGGLATWPEAVAERLCVLPPGVPIPSRPGVRLSATVTSLQAEEGGGWQVNWTEAVHCDATEHDQGRVAFSLGAKAVILAVPAPAAARLLPAACADAIRALEAIPHAPVDVVHLIWPKGGLRHPLDGFGLLAPSGEGRSILGSLWPSSLFPGAFSPRGAGLGAVETEGGGDWMVLANFLGGARSLDRPYRSSETVLDVAQREISDLLGATTPPAHRSIRRWGLGIPQYVAGHRSRIRTIAKVEDEAPGLILAGSWRDGVSLGDCWAGGKRAADRAVSPRGV